MPATRGARRLRTAALTAAVAAGLVVTATGAAAQDRDCGDFPDQASAQAAFAAAGAGDPLRLDEDGNGIACEALPRRAAALQTTTTSTTPTPTSSSSTTTASTASTTTSTTAPSSLGEGRYQVGREVTAGLYRTAGGTTACSWFRLSDNTGSSRSVIASGSGQGPLSVTVAATDAYVQFAGACRWSRDTAAPTGSSTTPTSTTATTTSPTPTSVRPDDRDCPDFPTQAQAQAALAADRTDPDALDTDKDGIACEELFGTQGRQVAVVPNGGVATGGRPAP